MAPHKLISIKFLRRADWFVMAGSLFSLPSSSGDVGRSTGAGGSTTGLDSLRLPNRFTWTVA